MLHTSSSFFCILHLALSDSFPRTWQHVIWHLKGAAECKSNYIICALSHWLMMLLSFSCLQDRLNNINLKKSKSGIITEPKNRAVGRPGFPDDRNLGGHSTWCIMHSFWNFNWTPSSSSFVFSFSPLPHSVPVGNIYIMWVFPIALAKATSAVVGSILGWPQNCETWYRSQDT